MKPAGIPRRKRCEELARQHHLSLADIIELTGQAPDRDGQIGIFDVDERGFRFSLTEETLRSKPAAEQLKARRLIGEGRLDLPCSPAALVAFTKKCRELALPFPFVRAVEVRDADLAGDRWRNDLIAELRSQGLAEVRLTYPEFLKLTTFSHERHLANGQYELHKDKGQIIGILAGPAWDAVSNAGDLEHEIAAEFMHVGRLDFPITAEQLIQWIRDQGLGTVDLHPGYIDKLTGLAATQPVIGISQKGAKGQRARRKRDDAISEEMANAWKELGPDATPDDMWARLASYAGKPHSRITDVSLSALIYRQKDGGPGRLTKKDLRDRMRRDRLELANGSTAL